MSKISTKNILKKIFKGKTETKVKKKVSKKIVKVKKVSVKKTKVASKKTKVASKKTLPKIKKITKATKIKEEAKVDNLRISKSNEVKPEIKK